MANNSSLEINLHKKYSAKHSPGFELRLKTSLPTTGISAIFGHSGSGKTTLLRCIAGLERANGKVIVDDHTWQDEHSFVPTHKRPLGFVFQDSNLFPHLSVKGNLDYAIKRAKGKHQSIDLEQVICLLGIKHLLERKTNELSGGERQRVAIARALITQPQILLMDEPLASLDSAKKQEILPYLQRLQSQFEIPILYVSHSIDEISKLADHVVILEQGRIVAQGSITDVFSDLETIDYLGNDSGVVIKGRVCSKDTEWGLVSILFDDVKLYVHDRGIEIGNDLRVRILAKDVSITLSPSEDSSILNRIPAIIDQIENAQDNAMSLIRLKAGGSHIISRITRKSAHELNLKKGQKVWAQIKSVAILD